MFGILLHVAVKYLASIMCDEVIQSYDEDSEAKSFGKTKTVPTNFNKKI